MVTQVPLVSVSPCFICPLPRLRNPFLLTALLLGGQLSLVVQNRAANICRCQQYGLAWQNLQIEKRTVNL